MARALRALSLTELRLFVREPAAVGFTLLLPVLLLLLNAGGDDVGRPSAEFGGEIGLDVLQAGLVVFVVATAGVMGLAESLANERERGVLRRLSLAPIRPANVLGAHVIVQLAVAAAGTVLLCGLAIVVFGAGLPDAPLRAVALIVLAALTAAALGGAIGALAPTTRVAQAAASALYFPKLFLSGAAMPRENLPDAARTIGDVLPLTYVVEGLRDAWAGAPPAASSVLVPVAALLVGGLISLRAFRWS
ncbi:ABC transporter permease [Solirubrobacter sp. CPCC 204708]|uniref:Transport permease protein n=1 Tax=Solirubrobacter deserti TaxID=2282478 RepID=A0ABT4RLD8_9ACTN|nr:ABC transporter permease [Solirubrobacter deserti]MBE2318939.1 ABC transporter permease [Solirubrobacter deserti]MDA0139336.1 ABC transporter permease [Solirubrobacter deserti]